MKDIIINFSDLVDKRFKRRVVTTEDSIRYTFFASLLNSGIEPHEVILEYPHPSIPRAKVDTWLPSYEGEQVAIEFKYDRDPPGGKNQPKTQKAGYVFRDLHRQVLLAKNTGARTYFVYVTTEEMAIYFQNPSHGYDDFFGLLQGHKMLINESYFSGKAMTFNNALGGAFSAGVTSVLSRSLAGGNYLRAYEVTVAP
jgi:hypothetical protein